MSRTFQKKAIEAMVKEIVSYYITGHDDNEIQDLYQRIRELDISLRWCRRRYNTLLVLLRTRYFYAPQIYGGGDPEIRDYLFGGGGGSRNAY